MNILLVEDEQNIANFIKKGFNEQFYYVDLASEGLAGERLALENVYDIIILDIIIPHINGIELCRRIRQHNADVPILLLTALGSTENKVLGFEAGADDYLVKPFHFEELLVRVNALCRRPKRMPHEMVLKVGDLELNVYEKMARRGNTNIFLTAREFALLEFLMLHRNQVLSRTYIAESVWGTNQDRGTNIIDVYINYLRAKIDKGFSKPLIHTIIGMGYMLRED
jgi:two-component system copper resistance phosphate regulon response regulator CusR